MADSRIDRTPFAREYLHIFSEQLKNLVQEGDLVIAISGSGNSPNVVGCLGSKQRRRLKRA